MLAEEPNEANASSKRSAKFFPHLVIHFAYIKLFDL